MIFNNLNPNLPSVNLVSNLGGDLSELQGLTSGLGPMLWVKFPSWILGKNLRVKM